MYHEPSAPLNTITDVKNRPTNANATPTNPLISEIMILATDKPNMAATKWMNVL